MGFVAQKTSSGSNLQIRDGSVSCEAVVFSIKERNQAESLQESQKTHLEEYNFKKH
ncbi:hypothetical protein I79_009914 [Cricetulus griseus]|uniref:Uncharacterized protein n=1 Tax=Cricetulus griseus TaxID=10029 RepID=G3HH19_CRIGR|nr:hypothetical protein I79_009914 [Cricetulus griseus]